MVLVDNSPHAYGYQIDNGIPIESWYDDVNDTELLKLVGFLKRFEDGVEDVRPIVHDQFKTHKLVSDSAAGKRVSLVTPPFWAVQKERERAQGTAPDWLRLINYACLLVCVLSSIDQNSFLWTYLKYIMVNDLANSVEVCA